MRLTYEPYMRADEMLWTAKTEFKYGPVAIAEITECGGTPLEALSRLARRLCRVLGVDAPELLADPRDPEFQPGVRPWAVASDRFEVSGVDPAHAMYAFCDKLEAAAMRPVDDDIDITDGED